MNAVATEPDKRELSEDEEEFLTEVERRRRRHERNVEEEDESFWSTVGMMGTVGWSVALPTAVGALLGRWLDGVLDSGHVFVVFFMLVGLGLGCFIAWRQVAEKIT
ncbi:MAG: AtpZ/AtpI family protein [Candidatus Brocadiia bacterium]